MLTKILVSESLLDVDSLNIWLASAPEDGAIVTFTGKVRALESETISLNLEHYQGMTESVLAKIVEQARQRWCLNKVIVFHRIGEIFTNESIVFVGVSSAHRKDSFAAAEFIMDILKTEAPFWKKEKTRSGEQWVDAKYSDQESLKKWQ